MPATFKKEERLNSFKEIKSLLKEGKAFVCFPFKVVYHNIPSTGQANAIMISVPKKNFKRAVKRNLLKRRIRESYRLNKDLLEITPDEKCNIMFLYISKEVLEYSIIERKVKEILCSISNRNKKKSKNDGQQK